MYRLCVLVLISGCDLQPPPPKGKPAPTPVVTPAATGSDAGSSVTPPPAPPVAPADAGPALARVDGGHVAVTQTCLDVGVRFAQVVVDDAKDLAQRAILEQQRTHLVRETAENCSRDNWPQKTLDCFLAAQKLQDAQLCSRELKRP